MVPPPPLGVVQLLWASVSQSVQWGPVMTVRRVSYRRVGQALSPHLTQRSAG